MSVRNLDFLFEPATIAVVGASDTPRSVGAVVTRNLLDGGFPGPIMPVHPRYRAVAGVLAYPDVEALPLTPELAILCTPPATLPGLIDALGRKGCRMAVVVSADADAQACRQAANGPAFIERVQRETGLRLQIITPKEEARLSVAGCVNLLDRDAEAARTYLLLAEQEKAHARVISKALRQVFSD